jgi:hypothetical protein
MIPAIANMNPPRKSGSNLLDGLISYWKLDESSGTLYDSHGSNNFPEPPFSVTGSGKNGNYAIHDALTDSNFYTTGIGTSLKDISISAWGKFRGSFYDRTELFCVGTYVFGSNIALQYFNGNVIVYLTNGSTYKNVSQNVNSSVWYHLCAVRNTVTGKLELWINGNLTKSTDLTVSGTLSISNRIYVFSKVQTQPMGTWNEGRSYTGIDESCIYNIALNSDQIAALANNTFYNDF